MADNPVDTAIEVFSAPIESIITSLGKSIAEAQRLLDQNSIQTQETYDSDPLLAPYGLQATWYQFPKVDLDLKISLSITQSTEPANGSGGGPSPMISRLALIAQPVSAAYQTHFNYDATAASEITLSIAPVPAPKPPGQAVVAARMSQGDVVKAALAAQPKFQRDGQGNPVASLRLDVNFNGAAGLWYVLQYSASQPTVNPVVVAVDDRTGAVRLITQ
jgi:hypothetical protein